MKKPDFEVSDQITIDIAGERCAVVGPAPLVDALRLRYRGFIANEGATASLQVSLSDDFVSDYAAPAELDIEIQSETLVLSGAARGRVDWVRGHARLENARDLGAVDAALRALVATRAPARGVLVLHGMVCATAAGALVLVGESGAGKSTAARELDAACDELVAVRFADKSPAPTACATPYWGCRSYEAPLVAIGVLGRGGARVVPVRGAAAIRLLAPHVVRYVTNPSSEPHILRGLAALAARSVLHLQAPTGDAFPPFIRRVARPLPTTLARPQRQDESATA